MSMDTEPIEEMLARLELTEEQKTKLQKILEDLKTKQELWDANHASQIEALNAKLSSATAQAQFYVKKDLKKLERARSMLGRQAYTKAMSTLEKPQRLTWNADRLASAVLPEFEAEELVPDQVDQVLMLAKEEIAEYTGTADVSDTKTRILKLTTQIADKILTDVQKIAYRTRKKEEREEEIRQKAQERNTDSRSRNSMEEELRRSQKR